MTAPRAWLLACIALAAGLWFALARAPERGASARVSFDRQLEAPVRAAELAEPELPAPALAAAPVTGEPERQALAPEPSSGSEFAELGADEAVLQVRVLTLESGEPIAHVPLRLETPEGALLPPLRVLNAPPGSRAAALTDRDGRCDCRVPAGPEL